VGDGVAPTPSVGVRVSGEVAVRIAVAAGLVGVDIAMVSVRVRSGGRVNVGVGTEDAVNVAVGATGRVLVRVGAGWVNDRVGVGGAVNVAVGAGMVLVRVGTGSVNVRVGVGATVNVRVGVGGRRTVRYSGAETASGPGFATLMATEPCVVAVPVAVNSVGELKVVDSGVLFQRTCTPVTNELPVTRRVNGPISN